MIDEYLYITGNVYHYRHLASRNTITAQIVESCSPDGAVSQLTTIV